MNRNYTSYWDIDYMNKLSLEDQTFLTKFLNEYYLGDFKDEPIIKNRKECYNRRHAERRDMSIYSDPQTHEIIDFLSPCLFSEDILIEAIDLSNKRKK